MTSIVDALGAAGGIVSVTGAGGKKTLMRRLALEHPGRVCLTATVRIAPLGEMPDAITLADTPARLSDLVAGADVHARRIVFCALPVGAKRGRYEGLEPALVPLLHERGGFDLTVVKADGARMRPLKAPGHDEPCVAAGTTLLVPVASVAVIGRPLDERSAHRPERVSEVTGAALGEPLTPLHLARLLASPDGARRGGDGAAVVPLLSHADDEAAEARAVEVAQTALALAPALSRVVVAALRDPAPVRQVVRRQAPGDGERG